MRPSPVKLIHSRVRWAITCTHNATEQCDFLQSHSRRMLQAMSYSSTQIHSLKYVLSKTQSDSDSVL